jgi:hypothetical protein
MADPDLDFGPLDALSPEPPRRRRMGSRRLIAAAVVALLALGAGAIIWSNRSRSDLAVGPAEVTVRGTIILTNSTTLQANCVGQGGYADMRAGASVVLTDREGTVLGSTTLERGQPDYDDQICSYPFTFHKVPTDHGQYAVEVSHRGKVLKSRAEMVQSGWTYFLSLT